MHLIYWKISFVHKRNFWRHRTYFLNKLFEILIHNTIHDFQGSVKNVDFTEQNCMDTIVDKTFIMLCFLRLKKNLSQNNFRKVTGQGWQILHGVQVKLFVVKKEQDCMTGFQRFLSNIYNFQWNTRAKTLQVQHNYVKLRQHIKWDLFKIFNILKL